MRDSTKGILLGALGTIVLGAAVGTAWMVGSGRGLVFTDGARIRVPASAAPVREVLWEPVDLLPDWINQGDENYEPRMSADGRTLLFVRGKAGGGADLFGVERTRDGWGEEFPLAGVNTPMADELGPSLSADGRILYFYSDREGGQGGYDLWRVSRTDTPESGEQALADREFQEPPGEVGVAFLSGSAATHGASLRHATWGEPQNLGPGVNSAYNDYGPAPSPDGGTIYFASNRPKQGGLAEDASRAWPATVREDLERRDYDLYAAAITDRGMGQAARLESLTTANNEGTPAVSPAGDFLYFASDRAGGAGGLDLYRARIRDDAPLAAENLGWPINTTANELDPALSMNGFALHFSSNRGPELETAPGDGGSTSEPGSSSTVRDNLGDASALASRYAIYSTLSREVFRVRDPVLAGFDWSAAWGAVWPWILLLGLVVLLAYLLRRALRDEDFKKRWRRLSLIAKCLILSLIMHALLGMLFTVWYVSGEVGELIRGQGGGTRVALVSRAVGSDLASQIRGGLTDLTVSGEAPSAIRAMPTVDSDARFVEATFSAERLESSDSRLELTPAEGAADSRPEIEAPRSNQPALDPLASVAPTIATPEAAAGQAAAEAQSRLAAQDTQAPSPAADLPTGSGASLAHLEVGRAESRDAHMPSTQTASEAVEASPSGSHVSPSGAAVLVDHVSGPTGPVATPRATAGRSHEESRIAVAPANPGGEMPSPALSSAALSNGDRSLLPQLDVARTRPIDANLPGSATTGSTPEASPAGSSVAPRGASVLVEPAAGPRGSLATPDASLAQAREELHVGVGPVESAQTAGAPTLPASPIPSSTPGTLTPERSSVAPEVILNAAPITSSIDSSSGLASGSRGSTRSPDASAIPTLETSVSTALPGAQSPGDSPDGPSDDERTLSIGATTSSGVNARPQGTLAAPALRQAGPAALAPETSAARPVEASLNAAGARGVESGPAPSMAPGSLPAPSLQIDAAEQGLSLALPGSASTGTTSQEANDRAGAGVTDTLESPTAPRPDLPPGAPAGELAGTALDPARVSRAEGDTSLAGATDSPVDTSSPPIAASLSTPSSTIPLDLSSLPMPALALPAATEEPPAGAAIEPIGTLAGVIRDAETGEPISSARIRLDLPDEAPIVARSNARGQYRLRVPPGIPDNVAISAVAAGYTPASINVNADEIERAQSRGGALTRDFDLTPLAWDVVPVEADPQVHHLGNDEFEGAINSQFQRDSEGLVYEATFTLAANQTGSAIRSAELLVLAKGAQANNPIRINGRELEGFIVQTPRDGSFGELIFRVPPRWLRAGQNTIQIESVRGSNDLDDFEFVNPRIRLRPSQAR